MDVEAHLSSSLVSGFRDAINERDFECRQLVVAQCSPCPAGGCADCAGGILRGQPGFTANTYQSDQGLALDEITGVRPIFECTTAPGMKSTDVCLGECYPPTHLIMQSVNIFMQCMIVL